MSSGPRSAFLHAKPRAFLFICFLIISLGALSACGADATVTTGGNQSEQPKEDTQSTPDTSPDAADPAPDVQEPADTRADTEPSDEDDGQSEDVQSGDTEQADVDDDAVEDDVDDSLPDSSCAGDGDCQDIGGSCIEPGGFAGCGTCRDFLVTCGSDADCAAGGVSEEAPGNVCERVAPEDCACDTIMSICKVACEENTDCDADEQCNPDGHCAAIPCSLNDGVASRSCGPNFECKPTLCDSEDPASCNICKRILCADDTACGVSGVCVNGACHSDLGTCELPRP